MARSWCKPSKRTREKYWPLTIALIITAVAFTAEWTLSSIRPLKDILSSVVNISSILIGFLATMMSILAAVAGHRILKRIKNSNATDLLRSYFSEAVGSGFIVAIGSTVMNLFVECTDNYARWLLLVWLFFVTYFLASAYRIMTVMSDILKAIIETDKDEVTTASTRVRGDASKVQSGIRRDS